METQRKCQLAVCECRTQAGKSYCSAYCEQAAAQAIPRDFCQCSHAHCQHPMRMAEQAENGLALPSTISYGPGQLTIEYVNVYDLRLQLELLAQALERQPEVLFTPDGMRQRRGPATERGQQNAAAQSA